MIPIRVPPPAGVEIGRWRLLVLAPTRITMPGKARVVDVPKHPRLDNIAVSGLIDGVIEPLITDLENTVVFAGGVDHALALSLALGHHLLAKHVLSGIEAAYRNIRMGP